MSTNKECRFYPVQCTEETFKGLAAQEGHVYFVTDKKKLFLGKNNEMIPMCANSGIFYGHKEVEYANDGNKPDPKVYFYEEDIEGEDMPEVDDLILNIGTDNSPDGCFYRVLSYEEGVFDTTRLTLQGTGGGAGGGGSTPGATSFGIVTIGAPYIFSSSASSMKIKFRANYAGLEDNKIVSVSLSLKNEAEPFYTINKDYAFNKEHEIDLVQFKDKFLNPKSVSLTAQDAYGTVQTTKSFSVSVVQLSLTQAREDLIYTESATYDYVYQIDGGQNNEKTVTFDFFKDGNSTPVWSDSYKVNTTGQQTRRLVIKNGNKENLSHGIYTLKVTAYLGNGVESNTLIHKFAYFSNSAEPLFMVKLPEVTEQFTDIPVQYLLVTSEANKQYTMSLTVDEGTPTKLNIVSGTIGSYPLYFEGRGQHSLRCEVIELGLVYRQTLDIVAYTGNLPIIDTSDALMLYLNPRGKINNAVDRDTWTDTKGQYTGKLTGVYYGNRDGWLTDESGAPYLQLVSGAKFTLDSFKPFAEDMTKSEKGKTGYTIELDIQIDGIVDYNKPIISCMSYDRDGEVPYVGFELVGNIIRMCNNRLNGAYDPEKKVYRDYLAQKTLVEGNRIRVAFSVDPNRYDLNKPADEQYPMCFTYLNGKLSGAKIYSTSDDFKDNIIPATLRIDSTYAQIKVYGIRFYSTAFTDKQVLDNYIATLPTTAERQAAYNSNNVYDAYNNISLVSIEDVEDYNLEIPYMKITGGYKTNSDDKWELLKDNIKVGLPRNKKDYRLIDVEVIYPKNNYFKNYQNYKYVNTFDNGLGMADNAGNKPSNGGCIMYAQGTSSLEYPVKNLRIRAKKEANYFTVRPDISPVEIICMKADYMESSGSHNTGAANLIDDLYKQIGIKTPGQEYFGPTEENPDRDTIVTCIKGHPCLIFYSETGDPGSYEYIGKYNLNLDKATPEPFGFDHDDETNFGYEKDETGEVIMINGKKKNSIYCYEFLDNARYPVCNFLVTTDPDINGKVPENYEETWYNTFWHDKDAEYYPGWRMGFESRYPEDEQDTNSADAFYPLASWVNELYHLKKGIGCEANKEEADNRFKNEYWKYLDKEFTLAYYLITEGLLMADSRVKNMMIATWGKEWRYLVEKQAGIYSVEKEKPADESKIKESHYGYIFYPIFYDMDTMLGLDNSGHDKFKYDAQDTDPDVYNGQDVLWDFVRDALPTDLMQLYHRLEAGGFRASTILPFFNNNQANMANEAFYNGDGKYKYVKPGREGYFDDLKEEMVNAGDAPYLYALQGDRTLHREHFVSNRMEFLAGKYRSNDFTSQNRILFRWWTPNENNSDPLLAQSAKYVPSDGIFHLKSLKTGYAGVMLGQNGTVYAESFTDISERTIDVPSSAANGTEGYILGLNTLSDLGDLSAKYPEKFIMSAPDNKVEVIQLGNSHKYYYNPNWAAGVDISITAPYLETFNFQNCASYTSALNFSNSPFIRHLYLTGSGVSSLTLPPNGVLSTLRLPSSIIDLHIEGHGGLTDDNFSLGYYDYGTGSRIEEKDENGNLLGRYVNDFSQVQKVFVQGTPINTYPIVTTSQQLTGYYLPDINWTLTEVDPDTYVYRDRSYVWDNSDSNNPVTLGDRVPANVYYIRDRENKAYKLYDGTTYPENEALYERFVMVEDGSIVCLPVLEYLQSLEFLKGSKHGEALGGTITIDIPGLKVDELALYDKYSKVYPEVKIQYGSNIDVDQAYRIEFFRNDVADIENLNNISDYEPYYFALTKGNYTLNELITSNNFAPPTKAAELELVFTFSGLWQDLADPAHPKYYQDELIDENQEIDDRSRMFSVFKPNSDMKLFPIFKAETRPYKIDLYDYEGTYLAGVSTNYNQLLIDALGDNAYYNYRADDEYLKENERYVLDGWISEYDYLNNIQNPSLIDLKNTRITADEIHLYAHYKSENYLENASHPCLFRFDNVTFNDTLTNEKISGIQVSIVDDSTTGHSYRERINGRITIPSTTPDGQKVTIIGDFANTKPNESDKRYENTLEFCFLPDAEYNYISNNAFQGSALTKINLPESIQIIGNKAFYNVLSLNDLNLPDGVEVIHTNAFSNGTNSSAKYTMNKLPANLRLLGNQAFYMTSPNATFSEIPDNLNIISSQAFMSSKGIKIDTFPTKDGECFIGYQSFAYVPAKGVTTLTINKPWKLDLTNKDAQTNTAFGDGYSDVKKLIVHSEFSDLDEASIWRLVFGREMVEGIDEIEILEG